MTDTCMLIDGGGGASGGDGGGGGDEQLALEPGCTDHAAPSHTVQSLTPSGVVAAFEAYAYTVLLPRVSPIIHAQPP